MSQNCPKCFYSNPPDTNYCGKCGTPLVLPEDFTHTKTQNTPYEEQQRGTIFAERYEIIEELGRGGMGKVLRVEDIKLREELALKLLKSEVAANIRSIERFRNELKTARSIRHKNICGMYDLGEDNGTYFITMEYVRGQDLKKLIMQSGQLSIRTTLSIGRQICEGMAEAHRLEVVHRDLKPSNIMIDRIGNAMIMDFGIARSIKANAITAEGVMIGTPDYMSPEQAEGKEIDHRSDIYSLGVILYEMVTGKVPFEGETNISVAMKHKTELPKDPRQHRAQIPENLSQMILKCLKKDKQKRYQSFKDIVPEMVKIESVLTSTGISALKSSRTEPNQANGHKKSIAVLPFANLSFEKEQEYFCDGLTEEIINALSHAKDLRVVARTSAFVFKGKDIDIREIGEKLNVDTVLEGSVRKAGDRLRITAQLITVEDGYHLWSERFDREMKDIFDIQDEITLEIVDKLRIKIFGSEKEMVAKRYTDIPEAYNLLLKARYFWGKRTRAGFEKGIRFVHKAIEIDPTYALAYTHLAGHLISLGWFGFIPSKKAFPMAKDAIKKALKIDNSLPQAYSALAWIAMLYDWDWEVVNSSLRQAFSLNPGLYNAHWGQAVFFTIQVRLDEAISEYKKALEVDPLSLPLNVEYGSSLWEAGKNVEALDQLKKTLEMDPNFGLAHFYMGLVYNKMGKHKIALKELKKAIRLTGGLSWAYGALGYTNAILGRTDEAEEILKKLEEDSKDRYIRPTAIVQVYMGLENRDKVFEWLDRALDERDPVMPLIKAVPEYKPLQSDPRFKMVLKKMNMR